MYAFLMKKVVDQAPHAFLGIAPTLVHMGDRNANFGYSRIGHLEINGTIPYEFPAVYFFNAKLHPFPRYDFYVMGMCIQEYPGLCPGKSVEALVFGYFRIRTVMIKSIQIGFSEIPYF